MIEGMQSLFATPVLRKCTLVMFANWISGGLVFYGLAQYMGQIGGNIFMNVFLSGENPEIFLPKISVRSYSAEL